MVRTLTVILAAALISSCATSGDTAVPWPDCARARTVAWLESGIPASWPTAVTLPEGVPVQVVSLGAYPPDAIHDAVYRTLHLVPSSNSVFVEQTGGISGMRQLYGPISLAGYCSASSGAP